ncbi:MAG: SAM-dependent chlorinase/fluorinase [Desulfohalobiaceae bacterium]|nr:SAM-dependent chlorinase/fluorinase [Desulfohalobiaceae bacterium]
MSKPIFALLTDFGLKDPYVGQMKAVLASGAPGCGFLDISHEVQPQGIHQAGFFLAASYSYLPGSTICLAVVDPGVGTKRRILCLEKQDRTVLAPDNGLLSLLLLEPGENRIFDASPGLREEGHSKTFHGRDVFAPLALRLAALEAGQRRPGPEVSPESLVRLPLAADQGFGPRVRATVIHIDRFGNCVLDLGAGPWSPRLYPGKQLELSVPQKGSTIRVVETYALIPDKEAGLLLGSQGYFELACNQSSCAERLGLAIGDRIAFTIKPD